MGTSPLLFPLNVNNVFLQDEYEASGQHYIMYRPLIHFLKQWFIEEQEVSHYLLDGMPSSGKSIVMAALVHWARLSGWVVCFLSSVLSLSYHCMCFLLVASSP